MKTIQPRDSGIVAMLCILPTLWLAIIGVFLILHDHWLVGGGCMFLSGFCGHIVGYHLRRWQQYRKNPQKP